ncbi:MAG: peptidoglycan binding domain-containing protein [Lachnospiraceae bacterium]|nr:peptidoglycan binding domain-containing protein [Lachnospiraceae bacterium]
MSSKKIIIIDEESMMMNQEEKQTEQMNIEEEAVPKSQPVAEAEEEDWKFDSIEGELSSQGQSDSRPVKSKKGLFIGLALGILCLLVVAIGYGNMAIHYQTCFMPGTYINDVDCGELEVAQVADIIEKQSIEGYVLEILGKDADGQEVVLGTITPGDVDMHLQDGLLNVQELFDRQNPFLWMEIWGNREVKHTLETKRVFSQERLHQVVEGMGIFEQEGVQQPRDAYLSEYDSETGTYEIIPEIYGNQLDEEKVLKVIGEALSNHLPQVHLETSDCYLKPEIMAEDEELIALRDTLNLWLSTEITYDWVGRKEVLDKELLADWISVVDGEAVLDEDAVAAYVAANSRKYDNYGANRDFVTSLGVQLNLPSGAFGWKTNREEETAALIQLIKEGTVTKREPVYSSKAPRKDGNNIGSSYVEIDLTNQHLYLYKDGVLVLESLFVSGKMTDPECVTPQGVFRITYKTVNATLRGGDYAEFVYYWMPFHGNYGMHDATWRTEFGGDIYLENGSHGCINLPLENAEVIYNYMYAGYPVICYY